MNEWLNCDNCGNVFFQKEEGQKYCSNICCREYLTKYGNTNVFTKCRVCGKDFEAINKDQLFCSNMCGDKYLRAEKLAEKVTEKLMPMKKDNDPVNSPQHYTSHPSGIECIQVTRHFNFNRGNAIKYIWRARGKTDAIQDLEKAIWYLRDEIARIVGGEINDDLRKKEEEGKSNPVSEEHLIQAAERGI